MNKWIFVYALIAAAATALVWFVKRRKAASWWKKTPFFKPFPLPFKFVYGTPQGATVSSQTELPITSATDILDAIDRGIDDYLNSTANRGFRNYRRHSDFEISMLTDWQFASDGSPALKIKIADAWRGTEFDKGGYMLAAGLTLGLGDGLFKSPQIFIPQTSNLEFLRTICRYEPEHIGAYFNDREYFNQTSGQHAHPLYPSPFERSRGFDFNAQPHAVCECLPPSK